MNSLGGGPPNSNRASLRLFFAHSCLPRVFLSPTSRHLTSPRPLPPAVCFCLWCLVVFLRVILPPPTTAHVTKGKYSRSGNTRKGGLGLGGGWKSVWEWKPPAGNFGGEVYAEIQFERARRVSVLKSRRNLSRATILVFCLLCLSGVATSSLAKLSNRKTMELRK